jgi:hypothetical protein
MRYPIAKKEITKDTSEAAQTRYEASHGDMAGAFTGQMEQCTFCGADYPMSEITYWRSQAYCPDCKSDIPRKIIQERRSQRQQHVDEPGITDFSNLAD